MENFYARSNWIWISQCELEVFFSFWKKDEIVIYTIYWVEKAQGEELKKESHVIQFNSV